jgi:hypothetical protein
MKGEKVKGERSKVKGEVSKVKGEASLPLTFYPSPLLFNLIFNC